MLDLLSLLGLLGAVNKLDFLFRINVFNLLGMFGLLSRLGLLGAVNMLDFLFRINVFNLFGLFGLLRWFSLLCLLSLLDLCVCVCTCTYVSCLFLCLHQENARVFDWQKNCKHVGFTTLLRYFLKRLHKKCWTCSTSSRVTSRGASWLALRPLS